MRLFRLTALAAVTTSWTPARVAPQRTAVRLHAAPPHPSLGSLTLVGAGPGDPELLTVAALRAIADSEALVICDRLVSPEIRELVRGELRVAGKLPGCAEKAQQQIYDWCREGLVEGRRVVRLKIGDPFVFGRGGEEVLEQRGRGARRERGEREKERGKKTSQISRLSKPLSQPFSLSITCCSFRGPST